MKTTKYEEQGMYELEAGCGYGRLTVNQPGRHAKRRYLALTSRKAKLRPSEDNDLVEKFGRIGSDLKDSYKVILRMRRGDRIRLNGVLWRLASTGVGA